MCFSFSVFVSIFTSWISGFSSPSTLKLWNPYLCSACVIHVSAFTELNVQHLRFKNRMANYFQKVTFLNCPNSKRGVTFDIWVLNLHIAVIKCIIDSFFKLGLESNFYLAMRVTLETLRLGHPVRHFWVFGGVLGCFCCVAIAGVVIVLLC